jgi:hypothetical protein
MPRASPDATPKPAAPRSRASRSAILTPAAEALMKQRLLPLKLSLLIAAVMASIRTLSTRLVVFDTAVVDLTD